MLVNHMMTCVKKNLLKPKVLLQILQIKNFVDDNVNRADIF